MRKTTRDMPSAPTPVAGGRATPKVRGKSAMAASRTGRPPAHGRRRKPSVDLPSGASLIKRVKAVRRSTPTRVPASRK